MKKDVFKYRQHMYVCTLQLAKEKIKTFISSMYKVTRIF